jgi:nitrite reductase/ring-hydroxylating ferredoxin subunit
MTGGGKLDSLAAKLQSTILQTYDSAGPSGKRMKNFLHGVWLRHPLHPALTDVPIGAWSVTLVFDLLDAIGRRERGSGRATGALAIGLAGAVAAALSGLTDWSHLSGRARRIGFLHGTLNALAALLYTNSLLLRLTGKGRPGRRFAFLGYGVATLSAYLGGDLVYGERIGVDHGSDVPTEAEFTPVLDADSLVEGKPQRVEWYGIPVVLVRSGGEVYALTDICTHLGCSLASGEVRDGSIICRCHGSRFSLVDGQVLDGPATYPETSFEVRVQQGRIELRHASA